ncbi:MAG: ribosome recycling factor [Thermoanaerobaculales bacterium]|nr:ribosome recycling factor [Thermoanaerobaculales bacterium]
MNQILKNVESRMVDAIDAFNNELGRLRTGRASLGVLDGIMIDYYGSQTPLSQVASLSVPDPTTIQIAPWEPKVLADIEKEILKSNLGMTPNNDGKLIRLTIPQLTEERRRDLVKVAHDAGEGARNSLRNIRRDGNDGMKKLESSKEISEDQMHDGIEQVQKLTDTYVSKIKEALDHKEVEIMEV